MRNNNSEAYALVIWQKPVMSLSVCASSSMRNIIVGGMREKAENCVNWYGATMKEMSYVGFLGRVS